MTPRATRRSDHPLPRPPASAGDDMSAELAGRAGIAEGHRAEGLVSSRSASVPGRAASADLPCRRALTLRCSRRSRRWLVLPALGPPVRNGEISAAVRRATSEASPAVRAGSGARPHLKHVANLGDRGQLHEPRCRWPRLGEISQAKLSTRRAQSRPGRGGEATRGGMAASSRPCPGTPDLATYAMIRRSHHRMGASIEEWQIVVHPRLHRDRGLADHRGMTVSSTEARNLEPRGPSPNLAPRGYDESSG